MVIETELISFWQWLIGGPDGQMGALWWFLLLGGGLALLGLVAGYFVAAVRHGPVAAGDMTYQVVTNGLKELFFLSPRRVWALTRLAIKESFRRKVLVVLAIYVAVLGFASWFLGSESDDPARLYTSFVFSASMYLVLLLALFLSAFSLPNDIKNRTIYTVVTKPVRSGEIVLGRILGFTVVGSVLLAAMGVMSYFFVARSLHHTHELVEADLEELPQQDWKSPTRIGQTTSELFHRHDIRMDPSQSNYQTETKQGHWHDVTASTDSAGRVTYSVSPPRGLYRARVPIYGKLRFRDTTEKEVAKGISVGNEWTYRSFVEGSTPAAAIWTFENVTPDRYPDGLPLELTIRVFRSHKGNIEKGILGSIVIKNPDGKVQSDSRTFRAKDFYIDEQFIPRTLTDSTGKELDLFKDLTHNGKVEVWVQCLHPGQYFGVAQADCYIRSADGRFDLNFLKGYIGIWVQMVLVICLGVMFSTFLSGPIAMVATLGAIVLGFFTQFILDVAVGQVEGGGPAESFLRMITQRNVTEKLERDFGVIVIHAIDSVLLFFMRATASILPNFRQYSTADFVANGFNIPTGEVSKDLFSCLAFVVGVFVAGYFFLRLREVAK